MEPIVPPELVTAHISRSKAHYNHDDWYDSTHVCHDPNGVRQVIVRPVTKRGLGAERGCIDISATLSDHCDEHTESLIVTALLFQARLQDLGRVLGTTLALYIEERTANGRQVLSDTL
jgi:hypothetical protein